MRFVSTRGGAPPATLSEAIRRGAAPDGGLYVAAGPVSVAFGDGLADRPLADLAAHMLAPWFEGDPLADRLGAIAAEAFDFPAPLVRPDPARPGLYALELFHGPTAAFKDFGARFLAACLDRLAAPDAPLNVLVATSGDTGGAVGCAAEGRAALRATILFPRGRVSPLQRRQLACWRPPALSLEVDGDFDDCQRLAKAAFADRGLVAAHRLTSANSINIGRLLPQAAYLAAAALRARAEAGVAPGFVIPTGNMGHVFAALLARAAGAPIGPLVAATNANRTLSDWRATGTYKPRPSLATLANAMDVGAPSNFERLASLPAAARAIAVERVDDDAIRRRIWKDHEASGRVWCPHSATAAEAYARLPGAARRARPWILAATAHPGKFAEIVEPLVGHGLAAPPALAALARRTVRAHPIAATLAALADALEGEAARAA